MRLRALGVNIHGIGVAWSGSLVLINKLLALKTSAHVLAESLDNAHVLEPAVVLLLTLAGSITDIRLRGGRADREGRLASLGGRSTAGVLTRKRKRATSTLEHTTRVAAALASIKAGAKSGCGRVAETLADSGKTCGESRVHDRGG